MAKERLEPTVIPKTVVQHTHKSFIPAFGDAAECDEVRMYIHLRPGPDNIHIPRPRSHSVLSEGLTERWSRSVRVHYGRCRWHIEYVSITRGSSVIHLLTSMEAFTWQVTCIPALGAGLFVAINEGDVGAALKPAKIYRLLDLLLNLDSIDLNSIDCEGRVVNRAYQNEPAYTALPKCARPGPPSGM